MKTVAQLLMVVAVSEAARCRIRCDDPFVLVEDWCTCECGSICEDWQTQIAETCGCVDRPCDPCKGGEATAADFKQTAQPVCACEAADGMDPCDAKYGGLFNFNAAGEACPSDEGNAGEGGEGEPQGMIPPWGSGAATITAAGLTALTALLI